MLLILEPSLVERAVFEFVRREAGLTPRYHAEFAACHVETDADARDAAFRAMHERWFERLGLRARLMDEVARFPRVRDGVARVAVADARGRGRQSVELFGRAGAYTVAVAVSPLLLLEAETFRRWIRSELLRVDDMLDPTFEFDVRLQLGDGAAGLTQRLRDRYALLWAISVDARLSESDAAPDELRRRRVDELARAFSLPLSSAQAVFAQLWSEARVQRPSHPALVARVHDGWPDVAAPMDASACDPAPVPGAPCPLCRFPTHDWMRPADLPGAVAREIRSDFPAWRPTDGVCGRCAELYRGRVVANPSGVVDKLEAVG